MPSVILASAWKDLGFVMVILLAGLQSIPVSLYEAARIDGASAWQRLRRVTVPLLTPSLFFVAVISLINGFQVFDQVFVMTEGGPAGASTVVVQQIYDNSFRYGRYGYASAQSVALFVIILAYNVPPYVGSDQPGSELHNTIGQLVLVLLVWAMVKRRVLFALIPR